MLAESLRYIDKRGRESKPTFHGKQAFEAMGVLGGGGYKLVPKGDLEMSARTKCDTSSCGNKRTMKVDFSAPLIKIKNIANLSNPPEIPTETPWAFNPALLVSEDLQWYYPGCTVSTLSFEDLKNYKFNIDIPQIGLFTVTRMDGTLNMSFYYVHGATAESTLHDRMMVLKVITNEEMIAARCSELLARTKYSETTKQKLEFAALVDAGFVMKDFIQQFFAHNYEIKTLFFRDSRNWQFMVTVDGDVCIMTSYGCGADVFAFRNSPEPNNFGKSFQAYVKDGTINKCLESEEGKALKLVLARDDVQNKIKAISTCVGFVSTTPTRKEFSGKLTLTSTIDDVKGRVGEWGCLWNSLTNILCGTEYPGLYLLGEDVEDWGQPIVDSIDSQPSTSSAPS